MPTGVYVRTPEYRARVSAAGLRRWGDPAVRFRSKVSVNSAGCWLWTGGSDNHGYGVLWFQGRLRKAHRVSWQLANGPIPQGLLVLHRCDNPPCVRPDHLFVGTQADNMVDMARKGRAPGGPGAKFGSSHHRAKLTEEMVREARRRAAAGEKVTHLAHEYGVSQSTMSLALSGRNWPKA